MVSKRPSEKVARHVASPSALVCSPFENESMIHCPVGTDYIRPSVLLHIDSLNISHQTTFAIHCTVDQSKTNQISIEKKKTTGQRKERFITYFF